MVDDEEAVRDVLGGVVESALNHLNKEEYSVNLTSDGYEAIERAKEKFFAIVFLDIEMPGINGVETFKEIKKISPKSVVIMITGYAGEELMKEAMREGAYTLLYKPFHTDMIFDIIKKVLEGHRRV